MYFHSYLWITDSIENTIKKLLYLLKEECWGIHSKFFQYQDLHKQQIIKQMLKTSPYEIKSYVNKLDKLWNEWFFNNHVHVNNIQLLVACFPVDHW